MLNKRCLSLLLCVIFSALVFLPVTTVKAADGELTVTHSTGGSLATEITTAIGTNDKSSYTKLKINIGSVDLSGDYSSGDWGALAGLKTLLPNASSLEVVYKSGTHTIPDRAMTSAAWLKTLIFTNYGGELTGIGNFAFYECTGLSGTLTIPSSVTSIGNNAFYGCTVLTSLSLPATGNLVIGNFAFVNCTSLSGTLTIPSSVTSIGTGAFSGCTGLTGTLTIPSSVTAIGDYAFEGCRGLSGTLTISSSLTSIGINAFRSCTGLTALSLPATSLTISPGAFEGCTGLTALTIPSSVTTIGESAFDGCSGLSGTLTIPPSVTSIGSCTFRSCRGLTALSLPADGSLTIGEGAFQGCTGLCGTIVIPSSVTSLGTYSFDYCTGLAALVFKKASAPTMSSLIMRETQTTAYYPKSAESSYTAQSGFPSNRFAYDDTSAIITSLNINGVRGTIDHTAKTVIVDLPAGTNLSGLKPDIGFIGKSISPVSGDAQDFSSSKRSYTVTPVSGTSSTAYSAYIMGYPVVSGSNTLSGTVGDVGDQTAIATVSAVGWPEKMTLKASIGGNEDIANHIGNGRVTFSFSSTLFEDFSVGIYPITVSADATTYNHAIAPEQAGTLTVKPAAPVIKTATAGDASVTVIWDAVSGADGYKVYSFDPGTKAYTEIASTTTGTSYTQSGLAQGATYYYAVSSYQTVGGSPIYSNYSAAASAATPAPPAPPTPPADPSPNPPAPATLPHVGTFSCNKIPAKANAGTVITIVPPTARKGYTMQSVSYSSSNTSVATADANGNVTFLAGGKVTIVTKIVSQMTDKRGRIITKTATVKKTVTVNQPIAAISLNLADTTIARTQKVKLIPAIAPSTASNKKLKWTSSNPKVAAVSSAGVVTGKTGGTAIITCAAKDGSGVTTSCIVTVTPIYPAGLKMSKTALTVKSGKTASLKATITPKNTDFKTFTWTSSNPAVATVDTKGKVKGLSKGTVTITATTSNGISASCTVTVP